MTNPSRTLREIASRAQDAKIAELASQLAAEFELQHNQQNNDFAGALGLAELALSDKLDALQVDVDAKLDTIEGRQDQMLKMLEDLQDSLRALAHRPPCMHPDLARDQLEAGGDAER